MPSENDFFFFLEKCQAKLVSVRLNEISRTNPEIVKKAHKVFKLTFVLVLTKD